MHGVNAIARAVLLQLCGRVVGIVISFAQLYLTVRYLGPASYGLLVMVIVFVGVFEAFTELGVGTVIVRRVTAGQPSDHPATGRAQPSPARLRGMETTVADPCLPGSVQERKVQLHLSDTLDWAKHAG